MSLNFKVYHEPLVQIFKFKTVAGMFACQTVHGVWRYTVSE